jgi:hypothetical protein
MVEAERGQIVVSREVHAACGGQDHLQFTEREVHLRKKDRVFSDVAYVVDQAYAKREDFVASYRYQLLDQDVFVGRTDELESIDLSLGDYCLVADSKAGGVILIEVRWAAMVRGGGEAFACSRVASARAPTGSASRRWQRACA